MTIRIFISYSQEDFKTDGRKLWNYLSKHVGDSDVFIDQSKTKGQQWRQVNDQKLRDSDIVIVIVTPAARDSLEVKREVEIAISENKKIIPCNDDPDGNWPSLPWALGLYDGVPFSNVDDLLRGLYNEIQKIRNELGLEINSEVLSDEFDGLEDDGSAFGFRSTIPILLGNELHHIPYTVHEGWIALSDAKLNYQILSLVLQVHCQDNSKITLSIPRKVIDAKKEGIDDVFFFLIDDKEAEFQETIDVDYRFLTFFVNAGATNIEIVGTDVNEFPVDDDYVPVNVVHILEGASVPRDDGNYLDPEPMKIKVGEKIRWDNKDSAAHTITSGTPDSGKNGLFDSNLFMPNNSFEIQCNQEGVYPYFCMVHPWKMGTIIVEK